MVKFRPFLRVTAFPKPRLKLKLGGLLLCLSFLLNYHPSFTFPPAKSNLVYAEITQQPQINSEVSPITFGLPHPGYITTTFSTYHPGIDLCSGLGMPIKPIAKGNVVEAGFNFFGLGLMVEVEHEGGYRSLYGHMGKIFVTKGQAIDVNDYLGEIGMTGHTSGPHTHLEVSRDGKKIDPLLILPEIRKYPKEEDFAVIQSATPSAVTIPALPDSADQSASNSATPRPIAGSQNISRNFIEPLAKPTPIEEPEPGQIKTDIKQQSLNNILDLTSPRPSSLPLPKGGPISLGNFGFLGFKK